MPVRWEIFPFGTYACISTSDLPPANHYERNYRIHSRPSPSFEFKSRRRHEKVKTYIVSFADQIEFQLHSGQIDPHTGLARAYVVDTETEHYVHGSCICFVAVEMLASLLDRRLGEAERVLAGFKLGVTIVHELTVSRRMEGRREARWE